MKFWTSAKRLLIPAVILFSALLAVSAQIFTNINANLVGGVYSSSVLGDYNKDGQLDILIDGENNLGGYTTVWRNAGSGKFSNLIQLDVNLYGAYSGELGAADFYNVGQIDALVTGVGIGLYDSPTNVTQLWHNLGGGNFTLVSNAGLPGIASGNISVGDVDNDGRLDIVVSGFTNANNAGIPITQIWRNLGNGVFAKLNSGLPRAIESVFIGDFDNDGYLDILAGTTLWKNLGNGTFTNIGSGLPGNVLAVGDFNNDGYLDVVINNGAYQIWLNTGNSTFTNSNVVLPSVSGPSGLFPPVVAVGDYDNDGLLDIALETGNYFESPSAQIWRNLGNGTFTNTQSITGATEGSLAWGDFNNDGRLDFLITGQQGTDENDNPIFVAQVWQNTLPNSNSPPTAPTNLASHVMGNGVKMMWGAATDDHTPARGLNYNIRVGSSSGGVDIASPEANPITGQRLVVQIGNAQERLFSLLTNLSGGKYYWSVQAIDTAFAGGEFASEATFVIPPSINSWAYQSNGQFQVTLNALATNSYTLQASTNLTQWTNLTSVIPSTNGLAQLTDSNTIGFALRYYRLSSP